jgi:exopolysaccharide biosynthesis protein
MNAMFGIVLFIVGTLGAFVAATAAIAYLRTMSVYMGMRKLYRASFNAGMILIAVLVSIFIAQMLMLGGEADATDRVIPQDIAGEMVGEPEGEFSLDEKKEDKNTEATNNTEPASEENKAEKDNVAESKKNDVAEVKESDVVEAEENDAATAQNVISEESNRRKNSLAINIAAWSNIYKGKEYAYIEIENGIPYVYAPDARGSFWYDLNNISAGRESNNIVVMANAGVFNDNTTPRGALVQNGNVISAGKSSKLNNTLVIDDAGNVGYTNKTIENGTVEYTDAVTGKKVSGRKIVSAVTAFSPIVINGKVATGYKTRVENYSAYRARSIFCMHSKGSYVLIANKGEGIDGGGWNFDDMATVALRRGCQFAFNLDGGGSTSLAWRTSIYDGFSAYVATERYAPTFIVFTADNLAPSGK